MWGYAVHYVVVWGSGHQLATTWDRAQVIHRTIQKVRPGEDVKIEMAETFAAAAVTERHGNHKPRRVNARMSA